MVLDVNSIIAFQGAGYFAVFIAMLIEGPIVTAIAAFAASFGIFNIYYIFILSILGNIIPDTILFFIGRWGRSSDFEKFIERFNITPSRVEKLEEGFKKHAGKTISFVKLTPFLAIPGLILAGFARVSIKRFFIIDILFNVIFTIFSIILGFYLGLAAINLFNYFKIGEYVLLLIVPLIIFIYWFYKKILKWINRNKSI